MGPYKQYWQRLIANLSPHRKVKLLCLLAFTLTASGCGNSGGDGITDPQIAFDDVASTDVLATTSDGMATPVASISSGQMDAYVDNPLVTKIPTEINGGSSSASSGNYITNPLIN